MVEEKARAKVNLFLKVIGRRTDGYHLLDSLVVFVPVADVVQAEPADSLSLRVTGPFAGALDAEQDNLVLRAARALAQSAGVTTGAALILNKRLPVASGIGGGSADAAATLRVLARLWRLALPPAQLAAIAADLGADVPVCLLSNSARMGGIGEVLGVAPSLPAFGMVLVNPGVAVSTPMVFRARDGAFNQTAVLPQTWASAAAMAADLGTLGNDLEAPAVALCPVIDDVLTWLRTQEGCLLAQMSGSGATCFGLFAPGRQAERAAAGVPQGWWAWGGD